MKNSVYTSSRKLYFLIIFIFIFISFFTFISLANEKMDKINLLDDLFNNLKMRTDFNGAILVSENGKVIFKDQSGYAFRDKGVLIVDNSSFELGSVSKTFTALALHILAERGEVDLTAPLTEYFRELPYHNGSIETLLSHTSGFYDVYEDPELREKFFAYYNNVSVPYSNQDYLNFIAKERPPLLWASNEKHKYSNTAYVILGLLIEKISGQSYFEFIDENILKPAGMTQTYLLKNLKNERVPSLVYGYRKNEDGTITRNPDPDAKPTMRGMTFGDDDLISTLEDMHKYNQAIRNGMFFSSEEMDEIYKRPILNDGSLSDYALGFRITHEDDQLIVDHTGSTSGFYAYSKFSHPSSDYGVTLFLNVTMGREHFKNLQKSINDIMKR